MLTATAYTSPEPKDYGVAYDVYIYIYTRVDPPIYIGGNVNSSEVEQQ